MIFLRREWLSARFRLELESYKKGCCFGSGQRSVGSVNYIVLIKSIQLNENFFQIG